MAPGTRFDSATENIAQFVPLLEHRYRLTPSRHLLAKHHQSEVFVPGDKDEYAGQLEHLIGHGVDAGHIVMVVGTQHMMSSTAYGPYHHCECEHLVLHAFGQAAGYTLTWLRSLRYLVWVPAAAVHEWLVGVGVDTNNKTVVVSTQHVVVISKGEPRHSRPDDGLLTLLALDHAAARLPRLATTLNIPMPLRRLHNLASVSAGQYEHLVWVGVDAGHESFVFRIQRVVLPLYASRTTPTVEMTTSRGWIPNALLLDSPV